MRKIISVSLSVLSLVILIFNIEVNTQREAWALQQVQVSTNGSVQQIRSAVLNGVTPVFIVLEGLTQVAVINANNSQVISSFNMTGATMDGFNIVYSVNNMECNTTIQICVVTYQTGGSGTCSMSPNLCRDRVVMFSYSSGTYTRLKQGYNYTDASTTLLTTAIIYTSGAQFNILATTIPTGGGTTSYDILVYNATDLVSSHPLILFQTISTGTSVTYTSVAIGTFTYGGVCCNNFLAEGSPSTTTFIDFYRNNNGAGCSVSTGTAVRDLTYVSDSIGTFWYAIAGTSIKQISQTGQNTCTVVSNADLTASTGGNLLNSIAVDSTRHEIYVQSNSKIFVVNETSMSATPILSFASLVATIGQHGTLASYQNGNNGALASSGTSSKFLITYWNVQGGGGNPPSGNGNPCNETTDPSGKDCVGQIDCSLPANANLALCFIHNNPKNNNGFSGTAGMFNSSVSSLVCAIGLVACNFDSNGVGTPLNGNVKTNGIGYIIAILGLAVLISIFWVASDHDLRNIPMFVWFIAVLGLLGSMVALNWLDPTFFIVAIIALVGLGVAKAKGVLLGDSF